MIQRFQIEDLVTQDVNGVLFRAFDTKTERMVAVRRFFPFGPNGGGLSDEAQNAFAAVIGKLTDTRHPALRTVIGGGCDPVDGMPFLVTEWFEGHALQIGLESGPCPPKAAAKLLRHALEICELFSQVLGEEAVWVDTDMQHIFIGEKDSDREFTFSIDPLKCLGNSHAHRGLEDLVTLAEDLIIWNGKSVAGVAGQGLDGWLNWFRRAARTTTLRESRENLPAPIRVETPLPPSDPAPILVPAATQTAVASNKRKASNLALFLGAAFALTALGAGGWALIRHNHSRNLAVISTTPEDAEDLVNLEDSPEEPSAENGSSPKTKTSSSRQIFTPADHDLLVAHKNQRVTLEGVFETIGYSRSMQSMYLQFSKQVSDTEPRGYIALKDAPGDLTPSSLIPLIGRKIRLHGVVRILKPGRPVIVIKSRAAIEEVK